MKVCIWFGLIALEYQPPGSQILFCDGDLLVGLGPRQMDAGMKEFDLADVEAETGMRFDDVVERYRLPEDAKAWIYNDNADGDGFTALFVDSDDIGRKEKP